MFTSTLYAMLDKDKVYKRGDGIIVTTANPVEDVTVISYQVPDGPRIVITENAQCAIHAHYGKKGKTFSKKFPKNTPHPKIAFIKNRNTCATSTIFHDGTTHTYIQKTDGSIETKTEKPEEKLYED